MSRQQALRIRDGARFRATAGSAQGFGTTPQQALAALMQRLPDEAGLPIVIWPATGATFSGRTPGNRVCKN